MDPTAVCGHLSLCRPPVSPWILRQESAGSVRGPAGEDGGQWGTSPALTKGAGFSGTVWRQQRGTSRAAMDEPRPLGKSGGLGFAFHSFRRTRRDPCFWGRVTCWAPLCLFPRFICFVVSSLILLPKSDFCVTVSRLRRRPRDDCRSVTQGARGCAGCSRTVTSHESHKLRSSDAVRGPVSIQGRDDRMDQPLVTRRGKKGRRH